MNNALKVGNIASGVFAIVLVGIGVSNIILVHPVPGLVYLLLSLLYLPQANTFLRARSGFILPALVKICLGILLLLFTLGVSDLGDLIDKWTLQ